MDKGAAFTQVVHSDRISGPHSAASNDEGPHGCPLLSGEVPPYNERMAETHEDIDRHAQAMLAKFQKKNPWASHEGIERRLQTLMQEMSTIETKQRKVIRLIDDLGAAVAPYTPCRAGCSHCCKTAVVIYDGEAAAIAAHLKIKAAKVPMLTPDTLQAYKDEVVTRYTSQPCPFLVNDRCSIYKVRPYVCRQQHTVNPSPLQCDTTKIASKDSKVSHLNFKRVEFASSFLAFKNDEACADIRDYFPDLAAYIPQ